MAHRLETIQTPGVNDVFEYNEIHLSSDFADNRGTLHANSNPVWALCPEISNVLGIKLVSAQIPFAWPVLVASGPGQNNLFTIGSTTYAVPEGNYGACELVDLLNGLTVGVAEWTYDVRNGVLGCKTDPDSPTHLTGDTLTVGAKGPAHVFGLDARSSPFALGPAFRFFPLPLNVTGPNYLLLTSRALAGRMSRSMRINGETTPSPSILAKIPNTVNPGGVIFYNDFTPGYCFDMGLDQLQNIDLMLLDGHSQLPVAIKGVWSVTLMVLSERDTAVPRNRHVDTGRSSTSAKRIRVR